jgi:hypothetical protein
MTELLKIYYSLKIYYMKKRGYDPCILRLHTVAPEQLMGRASLIKCQERVHLLLTLNTTVMKQFVFKKKYVNHVKEEVPNSLDRQIKICVYPILHRLCAKIHFP